MNIYNFPYKKSIIFKSIHNQLNHPIIFVIETADGFVVKKYEYVRIVICKICKVVGFLLTLLEGNRHYGVY